MIETNRFIYNPTHIINMGAPKGREPWNKGIERGPCPWVSESNKRRTGIYYKRVEIPCLNCNKEITIQKNLAGKRKFCCHKCYVDFYKGLHFNMTTGEWSYRNIAFRNFEEKCQMCGKDKNIIVHHKDGSHKNNKIENLQPLCRGCHNIVHDNKRFLTKVAES